MSYIKRGQIKALCPEMRCGSQFSSIGTEFSNISKTDFKLGHLVAITQENRRPLYEILIAVSYKMLSHIPTPNTTSK